MRASGISAECIFRTVYSEDLPNTVLLDDLYKETMLKYPTSRVVDVSAASQIRARLAFCAICEMMLPS